MISLTVLQGYLLSVASPVDVQSSLAVARTLGSFGKRGDATKHYAALLILLVAVLAYAPALQAQVVLVEDINPSSSSVPRSLTNVNGTLFFSADDGTNGDELWKSDGTAEGTVLIKDINLSGDSGLSNLINVNGVLFFTANDGGETSDLWKSDGSAGGTV